MTAIIILAGGGSRRLGRPKQMERIGAETLLARAVRVATESELGTVYAVVSSGAPVVLAEARRLPCEVVLNDRAEEGMAGSIHAGLLAVAKTAEGAIVMTCDQPAVSAAHLRALASGEGVVASVYARRRGVPAYFPAAVFGALMELQGDVGARELLRDARAIPLAHGDLDVDTAEELERARELFGGEAV